MLFTGQEVIGGFLGSVFEDNWNEKNLITQYIFKYTQYIWLNISYYIQYTVSLCVYAQSVSIEISMKVGMGVIARHVLH